MKTKYKTKTQYGNWIIYKNDKALNNSQVFAELQNNETLIHELLEVCRESFFLCDKITMPTERDLTELRISLRPVIKKANDIINKK